MDSIGRLAGSVAHDFNNLLSVIATYANLLEEAHAPGRPEREDAAEISRAAARAAVLTRQLLTLSRQSVNAPKRINVNHAVAALQAVLTRLAGGSVELIVRCGDVVPVFVDSSEFDQVLMNLVVNARDAMPVGGRIEIETSVEEIDAESAPLRASAPGRYSVISVTDTGIGMDLETQRHVFEPFFTTKEADKGTGLGLSIVHGIVGQAGGTVSVYSELGQGTTFRVYLPEAIEEGLAATAQPPRSAPSRTSSSCSSTTTRTCGPRPRASCAKQDVRCLMPRARRKRVGGASRKRARSPCS
jgi:signal transduction histidine kinase